MEKSRELNEDRHQSSSTKDNKRSSMHLHHHQPTKDSDKRARMHKFKQGSVLEKQSRKKYSKPESIKKTDMPPRTRRSVTLKPSPVRMGRKTKATNDQSLKGRLTRILSAKTDECNWDAQKKLLRQWGLRVKKDGIDLAAPLYT